jgi:hypothetical protein
LKGGDVVRSTLIVERFDVLGECLLAGRNALIRLVHVEAIISFRFGWKYKVNEDDALRCVYVFEEVSS